MKIMATWMTLEDLDRADTRQEYKGRYGQSLARILKYRQTFGLHFRYRHYVYDHNNRRHAPISIERTWESKGFLTCLNYQVEYSLSHYLNLNELTTFLI